MNKEMFRNFAPVLESEVLDEQQMNALEAGGTCEKGCKKSCKPGEQNRITEYFVKGAGNPEDINELK